MRLRLAWVFFVLGGLAAGCGGGGKSGIVPTAGSNGAGVVTTSAPATTKTTHATIALYVPAANKQASRKPFYISPNTQAFGVLVLPYTSPLPSPVPTAGLQMFAVATPSPCAVASAGGYQCTFTVTAPVGNDMFIVAAFAQVSPSPGVGPLSAFVSGEVNVSLSPSPGATPLSFTLNGVVNSVAVDIVVSPRPGEVEAPNTQVFTVGVPTSAPIGMTAYDSSGNVILSAASLPYYNPIVIQASPASDGLTLSLINASVCGSTASGASATINCGGDLNDVQVTYDGTPHPDASDHLIDTFSVYSTTAPNPTPSPATFVLQSNEISTILSSGATIGSPGFLRMNNGQFAYVVFSDSTDGWVTGSFNPSTGTVGAQTPLTDSNLLMGYALMRDGSYWVLDNNNGIGNALECFSSLTATTPTLTGIVPTESYDGSSVSVSSISADGNGNLWYTGWDENYLGGGPPAPPGFAGFFSSSGCASPSPIALIAQFTLTNGYGDNNPNTAIAVNSAGTAAVTSQSSSLLSNPYNGVWLMNTSTAPGAIAGGQTLNTGANGIAVAVDGAGNGFAAFAGGSNPNDIERMATGTTTLSEVLSLPPTIAGNYPAPAPSGLYAFSAPTAMSADRAMYIDQDYAALGLVENVASAPLPLLVSLPGSIDPLDATYAANGAEYVLDMDASENLNIVRILPTTTWWVPNVTLNSGCGSSALLTILERGDSGPFTVSTSGATVTPIPGVDHDFWLTGLTLGTPFPAQVTDAHGRTEPVSITANQSFITCGLRRRPLKTHRP